MSSLTLDEIVAKQPTVLVMRLRATCKNSRKPMDLLSILIAVETWIQEKALLKPTSSVSMAAFISRAM